MWWLLFSCSFCLTLCKSMEYSMPGFLALNHLLEFAQTHVHWVGDAMNPRDGGAWWAAVSGVAESQTQLKRLSSSSSSSQIVCFFPFFTLTNWSFLQLRWVSLSVVFYQQYLLILCHIFRNSHNITNFFIIFISALMICKQWSVMLLLWFWGAMNCVHVRLPI